MSPSGTRVAEPHVVEVDVARGSCPARARPARPHVRLGVEQVEDLVDRRHALLVGDVQVRELLDRVEEALQVADERDQHADRDVAVDRLVAAVQQDHRGPDRGQELDAGEVGGVQLDRAVVDLRGAPRSAPRSARSWRGSWPNARTIRTPDSVSCRYAVTFAIFSRTAPVRARGEVAERDAARSPAAGTSRRTRPAPAATSSSSRITTVPDQRQRARRTASRCRP